MAQQPVRQVRGPLERPLAKSRPDVSLSIFAFLFAEMVKHANAAVAKAGGSIQDLEDKLHSFGLRVGARALDLVVFREKGQKRETRIVPMLLLISKEVWKHLFNGTSTLEKSEANENEYMINDQRLLLNRFISVPRDMGSLNCGAFAAGIVEGILRSADFPAEVTAHTVEREKGVSTTILVRFEESVMKREKLFV
mmetsp:Transcript_1404/g.3362  ORF Transcript_1404/g.3362 Transcript_1404/m.3362 type:complete len:195 (+) Transcript_1404:22-606(+)